MQGAPLSTETFPLWSNNPPGGPPLPKPPRRGVTMPIVSVYRPSRPDGRAVLSLPGGGYMSTSLVGEGSNVARALAPFGITTFVLHYRLPVDGWHPRYLAPIQDAQRAMRLIRHDARWFNIDPRKLGIAGFSSGGHLGATLVTGYDDDAYSPVDVADRISARPAFGGLFYPVTTFEIVPPHSQSRRNLLGAYLTPALIHQFSAVERVIPRTPPLFLCHAMDDPIIPYWMSTTMLAAARAKHVPASLHLLEKGGHGFGAALPRNLPGSRWPELFDLWTRRHTGMTER